MYKPFAALLGMLLGSHPDNLRRPRTLLAQARELGWAVLSEVPGREIVLGAVTRPWDANPIFRPLPAREFAGFHEPGYVKIVWTLRADPLGDTESIFRTETRVVTTDPIARAKFRMYWAFASRYRIFKSRAWGVTGHQPCPGSGARGVRATRHNSVPPPRLCHRYNVESAGAAPSAGYFGHRVRC